MKNDPLHQQTVVMLSCQLISFSRLQSGLGPGWRETHWATRWGVASPSHWGATCFWCPPATPETSTFLRCPKRPRCRRLRHCRPAPRRMRQCRRCFFFQCQSMWWFNGEIPLSRKNKFEVTSFNKLRQGMSPVSTSVNSSAWPGARFDGSLEDVAPGGDGPAGWIPKVCWLAALVVYDSRAPKEQSEHWWCFGSLMCWQLYNVAKFQIPGIHTCKKRIDSSELRAFWAVVAHIRRLSGETHVATRQTLQATARAFGRQFRASLSHEASPKMGHRGITRINCWCDQNQLLMRITSNRECWWLPLQLEEFQQSDIQRSTSAALSASKKTSLGTVFGPFSVRSAASNILETHPGYPIAKGDCVSVCFFYKHVSCI